MKMQSDASRDSDLHRNSEHVPVFGVTAARQRLGAGLDQFKLHYLAAERVRGGLYHLPAGVACSAEVVASMLRRGTKVWTMTEKSGHRYLPCAPLFVDQHGGFFTVPQELLRELPQL
jgi:hypothetical protein